MSGNPSEINVSLDTPAGRLAVPLDDVDRAIIKELKADGRMPVRALAEKIHISRASAYSRINRLVDEGVITGFAAQINHSAIGLSTSAYVTVTIDQNSWRTVAAQLREIPYIDHIALVGGDFDVLVLSRTPDNAALRQLVLERIHGIPGVRATRTWLVFDEAQID